MKRTRAIAALVAGTMLCAPPADATASRGRTAVKPAASTQRRAAPNGIRQKLQTSKKTPPAPRVSWTHVEPDACDPIDLPVNAEADGSIRWRGALGGCGKFDTGEPAVAVAKVHLPPQTIPANQVVTVDIAYFLQASGTCDRAQLVVLANGVGGTALAQPAADERLQASNRGCTAMAPRPPFGEGLLRIRLPAVPIARPREPIDLIVMLTRKGTSAVGVDWVEVRIPPPDPPPAPPPPQSPSVAPATPATAATK